MTELLIIIVILIAIGIAANKWGQVWIDQADRLERLTERRIQGWKDEG